MITSVNTSVPCQHLIFGGGMLGKALALELQHVGASVQMLVRKQSVKEQLSKELSGVTVLDSVTQLDTWECCWLCVPDSALPVLATEIPSLLSVAGRSIIHCSGSVMVNILEPCKQSGARIAVLHPYQTFALYRRELFQDIAWGVETDKKDEEYFFSIVRFLKGTPLLLGSSANERALYHASAVLASNILVGIVQAAAQIGKASGTDIQQALPAIMNTTLQNALMALKHNQIPLSGPLIRGDMVTLQRHIEALQSYPELLKMYCSFHEGLAAVAVENGVISDQMYATATTIFRQTGSEERQRNL